MSEKLQRCRCELTAALERSFENVIKASFTSLPDNSHKQALLLQTLPQSFSSNNWCHPLLPLCPTPQYTKPACTEREPLGFVSNNVPPDTSNISLCMKKGAFAGKKNIAKVRNSSPSAVDSILKEEYKECHVSSTVRIRNDATNVSSLETESSVKTADEFTQDLLGIIDNTNTQMPEDLMKKLKSENELNPVCGSSVGSPFQEDMPSVFLGDHPYSLSNRN